MSEANFNFSPDEDDIKKRTDDALGKLRGDRLEEDEINPFSFKAEDDSDNNFQNSSKEEVKSAKAFSFEDKNDSEKNKKLTEAEIAYEQAKAAYERVKDKDSQRAQKVKDRMNRAEEDLKKERGEKINPDEKVKQKTEENNKTENNLSKYPAENINENLKKETEEVFQKFLEAEGEFQKIKNKRGLFKKTLAVLGIGKTKDTQIKKELEDQKKIVEELKQEYEAKFNEFSRKLVEEKERELKSEGKNEAIINDLIGSFAFDDKAISVDKKLDNGQVEIEKISTMEYFNRNQEKLLEKRKRFLSEKQREILKKIGGKYNSLSKTEKIIYGVGLSATAGATVMLAGGAAISVALGYGAWRGGKTLLRRVTVGALSGVAIKGMNTGLTKRAEKKNIADLEKAKEEFVSKFKEGQFNLFNILSEQNQKERNRNRNRKIALGVTAGALFGTAIGVEGFMAGDASADTPDGKDLKDIPDRTDNGGIVDSNKDIKINSRPEAGESQTMYNRISEDNIERYQDRVGRRAMYENYNKANITEALKLNSHFELVKGGNVWNSLSEHFNGDKQEIGKVLAGFRAETMENLMKNHGMSEGRANQFIEWRYRHMNIGAEFELKNGKLNIPDFDDKKMITRFEGQVLSEKSLKGIGVEKVDLTDPQKTVDFDKRKTFTPPPREESGLDSQATVKILDPEISAKIDQNINNLVKDIYGRQAYEWDVMKNKNALDIINGEYGNPIKATYGEGIGERVGVEVNEIIESEEGAIFDDGLDGAEINNRKELSQVLINLTERTGIKPEPNETVEQFIRRVETAHYNQGVGENISRSATVEVPDPDSFKNSGSEEGLKNNLAGAPERLVGWDGLKNSESWEILGRGDAFTRNHLKDLIVNSNLIPAEGESLEEFHNRALEKINGTARVPQTGLEESLNKVFGGWDGDKIDQWLKMREYKAEVIYDRNILDLNLTDEEQMAFETMKSHLGDLARTSGIKPGSGESLTQYIEKAQRSLKV